MPARLAHVTAGGHPRIVPTWFHWDGQRIVMATWVAGPHVRHPARRLEHLAARPSVTISIDTDGQPPVALQLRGSAEIEQVDGIPEAYQLGAERYLGTELAAGCLSQFREAPVRMATISVTPRWVGLLDFQTRMPGPLTTAPAG